SACVTVYNDTTLAAGTQYFYRIRANSLAGDSTYSSEVSVTTPLTGATLPAGNLKLWFRSDFGVTKDNNSLLSRWADSSGNGNDAAQAAGGSKPSYVPNVFGGTAAIRFNGSTASMNGPLSLGAQVSIFAVASSGGASGFERIICNEGHFYLGSGGDGNFASFYGSGSWGT